MRMLEAKGVSKAFGGLKAVSQVDIHVDEGEILGLIGPNGAGKTTLFNLLSGAYQMDSGTVVFNGTKISGMKPNQICRLGMGRTFQTAKNFGGMPLWQNVLMGALFGKKGQTAAQASKIVDEVLEFTGLNALRDKAVPDIPLAYQKRLEVARALATQPKLLMLDEMMAGLNPSEVGEAMELVTKIRDSGITIIMIEHVMKAIMSICDRIVVLHHGAKIAEGTPQEISTSKTVIEVYLGEC
ncbi:MAG: ABC transporter ATP-binding protein [Clostridiales bacterium]|jgi:branched-chain amino acid transport system ATP-binding protein|nr:ABC transporter ATP-binding protein [Clostridiales bacterium]